MKLIQESPWAQITPNSRQFNQNKRSHSPGCPWLSEVEEKTLFPLCVPILLKAKDDRHVERCPACRQHLQPLESHNAWKLLCGRWRTWKTKRGQWWLAWLAWLAWWRLTWPLVRPLMLSGDTEIQWFRYSPLRLWTRHPLGRIFHKRTYGTPCRKEAQCSQKTVHQALHKATTEWPRSFSVSRVHICLFLKALSFRETCVNYILQ